MTSQRRSRPDLDTAKSMLRRNKRSLVIVKNGKVLFETNASGIKGLLAAVDRIGRNMEDSAVADKIVGEAAAQLCVYSQVGEVYAVTLSQCGKDLFEKSGIHFEYGYLVPHILNMRKTDLCPFEKIVAGSDSPKEALERLRQTVTPSKESARKQLVDCIHQCYSS